MNKLIEWLANSDLTKDVTPKTRDLTLIPIEITPRGGWIGVRLIKSKFNAK